MNEVDLFFPPIPTQRQRNADDMGMPSPRRFKLSETRITHAGLMRCCLLTLDNLALSEPEREYAEGDVVKCQYETRADAEIILRDGAWEWKRQGELN